MSKDLTVHTELRAEIARQLEHLLTTDQVGALESFTLRFTLRPGSQEDLRTVDDVVSTFSRRGIMDSVRYRTSGGDALIIVKLKFPRLPVE